MSELKKCPFCGGEAKTSVVFGRAGVVCTECDANIRMYLDASVEDAVKAWNNRKPVDDVLKRIENEILEKLSNCGDDWYTAEKINETIEIIKEVLN